jgi:glycosyltransferase involved in cell wall biosynthesis
VSARNVAVVVHRYGDDLAGGAEGFARRVAQTLARECAVTVLTTCARDYLTWQDHYPPGESRDGDVRVVRFRVSEPRDMGRFDRLSAQAYANPDDLALAREWMRAQGPNAPGLLDHLKESGSTYDAVIFGPYLYATTADGIGLASERAILTPSLHDEPPARLTVHDRTFEAARLVLFHTPEEEAFARRRFSFGESRILGSPMDPPPASDAERFRREFDVARPYVLYVGRLDASKGVDQLVGHHREYRDKTEGGLDLVLLGPGEMNLPKEPWLTRTGFVSEQTKHDALAGATVVAAPSPYESLCYGQLEAWTHAKATLANAASPVLEGQSRRAGGGLWYRDSAEYAVMLSYLERNRPVRDAIGRQGRRYVDAHCSWDEWRGKWREAVETVAVS